MAPTPRQFDVCNGDADGLCALVQWRLHAPQAARLFTGLKREIELLERVPATAGDSVLVCDLSLRRNRAALVRLLQRGVRVRWFDHHEAGEIPHHPLLQAHVDTAAKVCTSLLVDRHLGGAFRAWAVVGAYGDNLTSVADGLAAEMGLGAEDRLRLRTLGESINYNAYGECEQDVRIAPARLYEILLRHTDPLALLDHESIAQELAALRQDDLRQAAALEPHWADARSSVYLLPDAPWSRRVIGTLGNVFASAQPQRAHALLKAVAGGGFVVSVRAPQDAPGGAAGLCRLFGGGGRAGAAGIDRLPADELARFIQAFAQTRWGEASPPASAA